MVGLEFLLWPYKSKISIMKSKMLFIFLAAGTLFFTSCRETAPEKEVIREREVIREKEVKVEVEKKNEGIIQRTGKKIDAKVNKEIDKKIEKIGDDN